MELNPQKVSSAAEALWARLQANSRSKRDFFAERRSSGVSEPMTFQKKSRRERYIVRDDVGCVDKKDTTVKMK